MEWGIRTRGKEWAAKSDWKVPRGSRARAERQKLRQPACAIGLSLLLIYAGKSELPTLLLGEMDLLSVVADTFFIEILPFISVFYLSTCISFNVLGIKKDRYRDLFLHRALKWSFKLGKNV